MKWLDEHLEADDEFPEELEGEEDLIDLEETFLAGDIKTTVSLIVSGQEVKSCATLGHVELHAEKSCHTLRKAEEQQQSETLEEG